MSEKIADELNILIVGVGGQGVVLMSELLGEAAVCEGVNVRGSEVLGMAVRGGSVVSTVRLGKDVHGPLIPVGKADFLIGMEPSEALRNIDYIFKTSIVILNTRIVVPYTISLGESSYPAMGQIVDRLKKSAGRVVVLDAGKVAEKAGSPPSANIVMLGALFGTGELPIKIATMKETIRAHFPAKLSSANVMAFDLGYEAYRSLLNGA